MLSQFQSPQSKNSRILQVVGRYLPEITTLLTSAYFTLGETILPQILPGTPDVHDVPLTVLGAFSGYVLAKIGRKFTDLEEAEHYVGALADFDRMILLATTTNDPFLSVILRNRTTDLIFREQKRIKEDYLTVLDTIPGFDQVRKYLDMEPSEICAELAKNTQR